MKDFKNRLSKYIKRSVVLIMVLALSVCTLFGCGGPGGASASGGAKILYIITDFDTFRTKLSDAVVASGPQLGVDVTMVESGNSVEKQLELVSQAKSQGYGAIILRLADAETALQMNTASNGLPIVYLNSEPSSDYLKKDQFIYVGSDEAVAGRYQAEYVVSKLGVKPMNIIIFEGEQGHSGTIGRTKGVKYALKDAGVNANIVFMDYANWSDAEAAEKFGIFCKTGQTVDAVFCNNDMMALGVIQAMKDRGFDYTKIPVCGVDAVEAACDSIAAGEMAFTCLQNAEAQAYKAVEAAKVLAGGGSISNMEGASAEGYYVWVPFEAVDASNVSQYR
ncbi:MAG: substrate-binding domain-containing protein [Lachnospiraceae bacterium]|nr:substrate-binding domain-containing protein [Lachnospiraceae bacterium]